MTIVYEGSFVGVVASTEARARSALARAKAEWDLPDQPGEADLESRTFRTRPMEGGGREGRIHGRAATLIGRSRPPGCKKMYRTAFITTCLETRVRRGGVEQVAARLDKQPSIPIGVRADVA